MQKRDRRTREERALRRAQTLLRLTVLLWIAVLLLCLPVSYTHLTLPTI